MSRDLAIKVENLSKSYSLQHSSTDAGGHIVQDLWALKDVSLEIAKGESVGIVGPNGSGKSTLLKILAGVTKPSSGQVEIDGRVASILDIGAGFHSELSGRENVFLNGQILGFRRKEIQTRFEEIVEFSGIAKFIDEPVKNYSNGMYVRLAFSILAHLDFDVYLLDEVLGVGDKAFREKCFQKIRAMMEAGDRTFLLISHHPEEIALVCQSAYMLNQGSISRALTIDEGLFAYSRSGEKQLPQIPDFVDGLKVEFFDHEGKATSEFLNNEAITISVSNAFRPSAANMKFALRLTDRLSNVVFNTSPVLGKNGIVELDFTKHNHYSTQIPGYTLNGGFFSVDMVYFQEERIVHEIKRINTFTVKLEDMFNGRNIVGESGPLKPYLQWTLK